MLTTKEKIVLGGYKVLETLSLPGMALGNFVGRNIPNGDASIAYGIIFSIVGAPVTVLSLAVFGPIASAYCQYFDVDRVSEKQRYGDEPQENHNLEDYLNE